MSNKEDDDVIKTDEFGFEVVEKLPQSNGLADNVNLEFSNKSRSTYETIGWILFILWLTMAIISGFHAYYVFPPSPWWLTAIRVYMAALFAPIYLFFIFMKSIIFNR
jgi:hypothetical protein